MEKPPPIIASSRVIAHATVDDTVVRTRDDLLLVDGRPLARVPHLAICTCPARDGILLFFCDDDWIALAAISLETVEAAKARADFEYRGIASFWRDYHHDDEAAVDRECMEPRCAFCGRSHFEVARMIEGKDAWICDRCAEGLAGKLVE